MKISTEIWALKYPNFCVDIHHWFVDRERVPRLSPSPPPPFRHPCGHARSITHLQSAIAPLNVAGEMTLHIASTTEVKSGWD